MGKRAICMMGALGALAALATTPAWAQSGASNTVNNVGTTLGLVGTDVPAMLAQVKADPYKAPIAPACDTIPAEILQLSNLLGPDLDSGVAAPEQTLTQRGMEAAKGFVPYSGVVRFVTGASKKDKDLHEAILAGYARRGFLRGMEINLKCGAAAQAQAQAADPPPDPKPTAKKSRSRLTKGR